MRLARFIPPVLMVILTAFVTPNSLAQLPPLKAQKAKPAEVILIASAANFSMAMKQLIAEFESQHNNAGRVKASYGSSGKIYAQIKHGAPFQLFFSADQEKPQALFNSGLTVGKPITYAVGALALWSNNAEFKQREQQKLQTGQFNKLALANPKLAPYGAAALEVLESLNLISTTRSKWVLGENVAQAYQFVASGNAELGFIALSQVIHNSHNDDYWALPRHLYKPIKQDLVVLKRGEHSQLVNAFLAFIKSDQGQRIIHSHGYTSLDTKEPSQ